MTSLPGIMIARPLPAPVRPQPIESDQPAERRQRKADDFPGLMGAIDRVAENSARKLAGRAGQPAETSVTPNTAAGQRVSPFSELGPLLRGPATTTNPVTMTGPVPAKGFGQGAPEPTRGQDPAGQPVLVSPDGPQPIVRGPKAPISLPFPVQTPGTGAEAPSGGAPLSPAQLAALAGYEEVSTASQQQQNTPEPAATKLEPQIASTPRPEAVLAQTAAGETANAVVRQVATNLQYVARGEVERLRFDLYPEELGRVQVQLQKAGAVSRLFVVTETSRAVELLRSGLQSLQQSLADAGFDADEVIFGSRDDEGGSDLYDRRDGNGRRWPFGDDAERREVLIRRGTLRKFELSL